MKIIRRVGATLAPYCHRTGHYGPVLNIAVWSLLFPISLLPGSRFPEGTAIPWVLALMSSSYLTEYHDKRLCEKCIRKVPVNAQEKAQEIKKLLRFHHARHTLAGSLAILAFLVVATWLPPFWPGFIGLIIGTALIYGGLVADRLHRRLYPWCPYCKWGRGGDGEREPSPDPSVPQSA